MSKKYRLIFPVIFCSLLLAGLACVSCKRKAPEKKVKKPQVLEPVVKKEPEVKKVKEKSEAVGKAAEKEEPIISPELKPQLVGEKPLAGIEPVKNYLIETNTQLVEGFASIDSFSYSGSYNSWQGKVPSWWEYSNKEEQEVVWHSEECPGKKSATLVFSGVLGIGAGEAQLYVNDKAVLRLNTGIGPETEEWKSGDFRLKFFAMVVHSNKERWGVFCLTIPEEEITAEKSIKLKVTSYQPTGTGGSYFMLSGVPDTLNKLNVK